ncbi:hypothetical protein ACFXP3_06365 [Streptomyces sp. NPDC059096]|uniref:hypothetical protein n=1 Tax=Streptomyces sp. NPDC059096 TaxID=3346727 RepID=UPI0036AEBD95
MSAGRKDGREVPDVPSNDLTGNGTVNNGPENELSGRADGEAAEVTEAAEQAEEPDEPDSPRDAAGGVAADTGDAADTGAAEDVRDRRDAPDRGADADAAADAAADVTTAPTALTALRGVSGAGASGAGLPADPSADLPADPSTDLSTDLGGALDGDELALRRLLHGAVGDLRPSDGALDHLRKAVPTRRARKRQAVVGMAAAALLFGTAVPAFVHVTNASTASDDHPVAAGHGEKSPDGADTDPADGDRKKNPDGPSDKVSADEDEPDKQEKPDPDASDATGGGKGGTAEGSGGSSSVSSSQTCTAGQLRQATAEVGAADATGKVYGTFRLTNVSASGCTVSGRGSVGFGAIGAADSSRIGTSPHFAGDAAAGLPDPSLESSSLTLPPNGTYQVKFAWVPSDTCPTSGDPSPDPSPTGDGSAGTTGGTTAGTGETGPGESSTGSETQLLNDGTTEDGSVSLSYTAAAGTTVQATIPNACAGTVYWTGLLSGF